MHAAPLGALDRGQADISIHLDGSFKGLRHDWDRLALASNNVFATWEWHTTWWRHFGRGRLILAACRREGQVFAILPLYRARRGPLRVLRFSGHGPADEVGPVCGPGDRVAAIMALRRVMASIDGWDLFIGDALPADERWDALLDGIEMHREGSPVLVLDYATWDDFTGRLTRKFRREIRSSDARASRVGRINYVRADSDLDLDIAFDIFEALHDARWSGGRSSLTRYAAFHRDFSRIAAERGWLRMWLLQVDGSPAAIRYDFVFGDAYHAYNAGRDPGFSSLSPGLLLRAATLRTAIEDGLRSYRFLRGSEPYKYRFPVVASEIAVVAKAKGPIGRLAVSVARSLRRFERMRRLVRRLASNVTSRQPA